MWNWPTLLSRCGRKEGNIKYCISPLARLLHSFFPGRLLALPPISCTFLIHYQVFIESPICNTLVQTLTQKYCF